MHELLQYLNRQGATTFLTVAQHGLVGEMKAPVDVTYLADTVILLRYFEAFGRVRRAISVIKKRTGAHEDTIREFRIGAPGHQRSASRSPDFQGDPARRADRSSARPAAAGAGRPGDDVTANACPRRVLVLAPCGRDAAIAAALLGEAGIGGRSLSPT